MKHGSFLLLVMAILGLGLTLPRATPAAARPLAAFSSTPDQDSGWVRAQVVGGGCNGNGSCTGTVTPGAPTLYEYVPDREPTDQDNNLGANRSQHGGHPTAYARQICSIGGQQMGWAAGMWHHGATWTKTSSGVWQGPTSPHWVFSHDDRCTLPDPTPTPTVMPTATPQPGILTVNVLACGQPFGTRITRTDTGEARDGASSASFTVPSGQTIPIRASGYGDYADTSSSGQAGQTITIAMTRLASAGPCTAPLPTSPPGGSPTTPTPPPSGPPCTPTSNIRYLVLGQGSPAPAPANAPTRVPAGPLVVQFATSGSHGGETGQVVLRLVDVTAGATTELAKVTFVRPYANGAFTSSSFRPTSAGAGAWSLQTSANGTAFVWNNGWVRATTPALVSGHTYRIDAFHAEAASCGSWNVSNYVIVDAGPLTIQVRYATLGGVDSGPIPGRTITVFNAATGQAQTLTSDGQGTATLTVPPPFNPADPQRNYVSIRPDLPATEFVWQITGSCAEQVGVSADLEAGPNGAAGALRFVRGGCTAIFTYIAIPTVTARVTAQEAGHLPAPFAGGTLSLVAADGAILGQVTPGTALTAVSLTGATLRPHVRESRWSLSYAAPPATPPWVQLLPVAGSGGDLVAGDLALTFAPGDTTGNLFRLERGATPPADPPMLAGSVVLIQQNGASALGPYGTVELQVPGQRPRAVAVDGQGRFLFQLSTTTTTTVALQFTKNLAEARYDHAETGTVNGQASGQAGADGQSVHQIVLPPGASGQNYRFVLREVPPPPPPPVAQGTLTLWAHSHLDPAQGVYQSAGQALSILHAEVFDITPHIALQPLPLPPAGYAYDQRVLAWAFDGTSVQKAREPDGRGRSGCRPGAAPSGSPDTSLLQGCVYRYVDAPNAGDMAQQVRLFWKVGAVPEEPAAIYAYTLPRFQAVGVQVAVLVETSVTDTVSGQRWTQQQVMPGSVVIQLVTPRTTK